MNTLRRSLSCSGSAIVLFGMLAIASQAHAQAANPFAAAVPAATPASAEDAAEAPSPTLRRFGAGSDQLFLSGERDTKDIAFYVTAMETAQAARLMLSLESAISVMPETSRMQVFVNGEQVAISQLGSAERLRIAVDLPAGLLQPGYNAVRFVATQRHRVDCSVPGTYELWTRIDPQASGIDFGLRSPPADRLPDIAAFVGNGGDSLNINVVVPDRAPGETIDRAMSVVQAVGILGNVVQPRVTFSKAEGTGPGFDVVIGSTVPGSAGQPANSLAPDVVLVPNGDRAQLVLGDAGSGSLDETVAAFVSEAMASTPAGTEEGLAALAARSGTILKADEAVPLPELGLDTTEFSGRFYRSKLRFALPSDFYSADYDRAELTLDAAYAEKLERTAQLIVKANDRQVTSIPLSSSSGGVLRQQTLKIPLGMLKPGPNTISFEAFVPRPEDEVCDPAAMTNDDPRFAIRPTSTLSVPNVARIGHLPDLSVVTNGGSKGQGDEPRPMTMLAAASEPEALDAAATLVARIAAASGEVRPVSYQTTLADEITGDVLAAGTFDSLPERMLSATGLAAPSNLPSGQGLATERGPITPSEEATPTLQGLEIHQASLGGSFVDQVDVGARLAELGEMAASRITALGSSLSSLQGLSGFGASNDFVSPGSVENRDAAQAILAQAATPGAVPYSWTVLAAGTPEALSSGVAQLTEGEMWGRIEGAAAVLDPSGDLSTMPAVEERLFETQPRSVSNLRLVFAGWLSRHFHEYLVALILLMLMLGVSTRLLVRRIGTKVR